MVLLRRQTTATRPECTLLSWGVKDLAAPLVIACLPLQSSRGKIVAKVLTGALGLLSP